MKVELFDDQADEIARQWLKDLVASNWPHITEEDAIDDEAIKSAARDLLELLFGE